MHSLSAAHVENDGARRVLEQDTEPHCNFVLDLERLKYFASCVVHEMLNP
jgi:hypothetical protein